MGEGEKRKVLVWLLAWCSSAVLGAWIPTMSAEEAIPVGEEAAAAVLEEALPLCQGRGEHYRWTLSSAGEGWGLDVSGLGAYHVNLLFPWRYRSEAGVRAREAFSLATERARLLLSGDELTGELRLSVCTASRCLVETVQVACSP